MHQRRQLYISGALSYDAAHQRTRTNRLKSFAGWNLSRNVFRNSAYPKGAEETAPDNSGWPKYTAEHSFALLSLFLATVRIGNFCDAHHSCGPTFDAIIRLLLTLRLKKPTDATSMGVIDTLDGAPDGSLTCVCVRAEVLSRYNLISSEQGGPCKN